MTFSLSEDEKDAHFARNPGEKRKFDRSARKKRKKYGGRKPGSINKRTVERLHNAEKELAGARISSKRLAIDYMDEMIIWFRNLVGVLVPFNPDGSPRPGYDQKIWFRAVDCFQSFLAMRAPYQSARLTAVAIMNEGQEQTGDVNPEDLEKRLAARGLPARVFGFDAPVIDLEAEPQLVAEPEPAEPEISGS